jgi:hypothetical protein
VHERVEPEDRLDDRTKRKESDVAAFDVRHFVSAHQRRILNRYPLKQGVRHDDDGAEKSVNADARYDV